jgi:hypothetical protein
MEHYRSTLSTMAIAVLGLVVAARVLHPGNYEEQPRHTRSATVQAMSIAGVAKSDVLPEGRSEDMTIAVSEVLTPSMTIPLPPGVTMAPILPTALKAEGRDLGQGGFDGHQQMAQGASPTQ